MLVQSNVQVRSGASDEGYFEFEISNIDDFKIISEGVKFTKERKNRFNVSAHILF